jgi:signal transduction histidine kinase
MLDVPTRSAPEGRSAVLSGRVADAVLIAVALIANIGGIVVVRGHEGLAGAPGVLDLVLVTVGPALLWWRRRFPALVLLGCVATTWAYVFVGSSDGPVYLPMIVALVSAITHGARVMAYAVVLGTLTVRLVASGIPGIDAPSLTATTGLAAWLAFLVALGELLRFRRALVESRRQRLQATLDARADQVRREAAEHRLGLARDLHDVLGHKLSVINIQAKAGLQLHVSGKPGVTAALEAVDEASGQALEDVQAFLDNLREPHGGAARAPSPSLSDPDSLLAPARAAGLDLQLEVTGTPRRLPAPHDLVAGRAVIESLTNVLRHAGLPPTWVRIDYAPDRVTIRVDNATSDRPRPLEPSGGGTGLATMRQRLAAHGGSLSAGPTAEHAWSVAAVLPVPKEHS